MNQNGIEFLALGGGGIAAEGLDVGFVFFSSGGFLVPDVLGSADEVDGDIAILAGNAVGVGFLPREAGEGGQQIDADGRDANERIQETGVWIQKEGGIQSTYRDQLTFRSLS
jgi:hypothetical protein